MPPIHKAMGDHASRGPIPAGAFAVTWQKRGMKTEWKRVVEKESWSQGGEKGGKKGGEREGGKGGGKR